MKLKYNSPVVLTYTLICTAVLFVSTFFGIELRPLFTIMSNPDFSDPVTYFRFFSHIIGHGDWAHLVGNFTFILLLGPILEEKYGSRDLLIMILVTALITGILHIIFFSEGLLGASGVVFMMILLSSVTNSKGGIPMTFILVVILFLGKEVIEALGDDNISQFAHIIGGILGGVLCFFLENGGKQKTTGV
ncbi:MAG: rhomboid family intramembrane serine protease [Bacteroidia bacterium]